MKVYLIAYLIIVYIVNTVFVFIFSSLLGKTIEQTFFQFIASSVYYVLPYTLINFVLTGIASCYLIKMIFERRKFILLLLLLLLLLFDTLLFIQFFNNSDFSIVTLRIGFIIVSYLMLLFAVLFLRRVLSDKNSR